MATDNPNLAPVNPNGKETDPPKKPQGVNSSTSYQNSGSSLPKLSQGVLNDTMTEINNLLPVAGCPIRLPNTLNKIMTQMGLYPEVEANRLAEWAEKLGEFLAPIVEAIANAVKALKQIMNEIMYYINQMMELIKEIQQFISDVMSFVSFVLSLPARLMQLVMNCLSSLISGASNYVSEAFTSFQTGISNGISTVVPINETTGTYTTKPPKANT